MRNDWKLGRKSLITARVYLTTLAGGDGTQFRDSVSCGGGFKKNKKTNKILFYFFVCEVYVLLFFVCFCGLFLKIIIRGLF